MRGNLAVTRHFKPLVSCYPRGVCHCPHMKKRPFQARVWWQGRYWSLGYFASITEAEIRVNRVYAEMAEWQEMQLPPPTLLPLLQRREEQQASRKDPSLPASGTGGLDPEPCPLR